MGISEETCYISALFFHCLNYYDHKIHFPLTEVESDKYFIPLSCDRV